MVCLILDLMSYCLSNVQLIPYSIPSKTLAVPPMMLILPAFDSNYFIFDRDELELELLESALWMVVVMSLALYLR